MGDAPLSDWYYGRHATEYETQRRKNPLWQREHDAVAELLHRGPVLDVPIGTGRYIPIYLERGLGFSGVDISEDMLGEALKRADFPHQVGTITDLPFLDDEFGTAVCTRLMNWLSPDDMRKAVYELLRVAREAIIGIRFGRGPDKMQDHTLDGFLDALRGAWVERWIQVGDNDYWITKVRCPEWADVDAQFQHQPKSAQFIAEERYSALGMERRDVSAMPVRCEYWTGPEIWAHVQHLGKRIGLMQHDRINGAPRRDDCPITMLDAGDMILLDGRHRAKQWKDDPTRRAVFILDYEGAACSS